MLSTVDAERFLARGIETMGLRLDDRAEVLVRLVRYYHELLKWNRKVNLVARTLDDRQILENHFLDSLTLLSVINRENIESETLLDVGTGAGFPGMVLKAACPALRVVLVEPRVNRYYFLKHIARTLAFQDVELFNIRLEEGLEPEGFGNRKFTLITSRAFTEISGFARLAAPYLDQNGRIVCMKGPGAAKELAGPDSIGLSERFQVIETKKLRLPYSKAERTLVLIGSADQSNR